MSVATPLPLSRLDHTHFPPAGTLQTGDLLFPRVLRPNGILAARPFVELGPIAGGNRSVQAHLGAVRVEVATGEGGTNVGEALRAAASNVRAAESGASEVSKSREGDGTGGAIAATSPSPTTRLDASPAHATAATQDFASPDRLMLLVKILRAAFPELLSDWLSMTVNEFLTHPIARLLISALEGDAGDGFFVGHAAMVLRDNEAGESENERVFVIEANTTDFSHYRVAIHPYFCDNDDTPDPGYPYEPRFTPNVRGWANRRLALGQSIWHSRHEVLEGAAAQEVRERLAKNAKRWLGRPYGFFDNPRFEDTDHFYCSELLSVAFRDTASELSLDANRTWQWQLDSLDKSSDFAQSLDRVLDAQGGLLRKRFASAKFFILTVAMLYRHPRLKCLLQPGGQAYA